VDLKVQDKLPLHGSLELNDKYSPNTTETRLNGSLRYENLWQKDHSIGISFQLSPQDLNEVKVVSATYVIPRMNGDYFAAYGVISKSDIAAVGDVNVIGNGYIAGMRYIHPLPLVENYYHSLTMGADYKDFKESVSLLGSDGFKTPIAYTSFSLGYDGTYNWAPSNKPSSQTHANITLNFAPRALGNEEKEFAGKRFNAKPNYAYLKADLKHIQKLPNDWSIQASLNGQVANEPLISAEQFTIGGVDSVRGYLESSALGDEGVSGTLELRTPPLIKYIKTDIFNEFYAYGFIDAGYVSIYDALPNQDKNSDLFSAGLGVKLKAAKGFYTNLDYAHALRDSVDVKSGDDRLHFKVGFEW
jgi:hemolysin activation/secretion protein